MNISRSLYDIYKYFTNADNYKRIFNTLIILVIYKFMMYIHLPGLDMDQSKLYAASQSAEESLSTLDILTGGSISRFSITFIGIQASIYASIFLQILTAMHEPYKKLRQDPAGRQIIANYKKYLTLIIGIITGFVTIYSFRFVQKTKELVLFDNWNFFILSAMTLATASFVTYWFSEQINERGLGDGSSMLIYSGIITYASGIYDKIVNYSAYNMYILLAFFVILYFVIFGQKMYQNIECYKNDNDRTYVKPIKINTAGIYPAMFSSAIISGLVRFVKLLHLSQYKLGAWIVTNFSEGNTFYIVVNSVIIFLTTYIYSEQNFQPKETVENLKKQFIIIKGVKYQDYEKYFYEVLAVLSVIGGLYLAIASALPTYLNYTYKEKLFLYFAGTSFIIIAEVSVDLYDKIKSGIQQQKNLNLSFNKTQDQ